MKSLLESAAEIISASRDVLLVESYFIDNVDKIADIVENVLSEQDVDISELDEAAYEDVLNYAISHSLDNSTLNEGFLSGIKSSIKKAGNLFSGSTRNLEPASYSASRASAPRLQTQGPALSPAAPIPAPATQSSPPDLSAFKQNPKRAQAQEPQSVSPPVQAAKEQIKRRIQVGHHAKKSLNSMMTPQQKAGVSGGKIRSRKQKDGSVKHYLVSPGGKGLLFASSNQNSDGTWSHTHHDIV